MGRDADLVFLVHVAGEPGQDFVQRCVACGAELLDNGAWLDGRVAVPVDDAAAAVPTWWPSAALVATSKPRNGAGGGVHMTYLVDGGRGLDDDERPCTPTRGR